jgi:hypothetical protein
MIGLAIRIFMQVMKLLVQLAYFAGQLVGRLLFFLAVMGWRAWQKARQGAAGPATAIEIIPPARALLPAPRSTGSHRRQVRPRLPARPRPPSRPRPLR